MNNRKPLENHCTAFFLVLVFLFALLIRLEFATQALKHSDTGLLPLVQLAGRPDASRFVFTGGDTVSYLRPALALVHLHRFAHEAVENSPAEVLRTPGYPLFLAILIALGAETLAPIVAVQCLLSALACVLVFLIAARVAPGHKGIALLAGLLCVFDITQIRFAYWVMSESLFSLLLAAAIYATIRFREELTLYWGAVTGLLWAASAFVRPLAYYALPAVALWALVIAWRAHSGARPAYRAPALALIALMVLPVLGWQLHNKVSTGASSFSVVGDFNLLYWRGAFVLAEQARTSHEEAMKRLRSQYGWADDPEAAQLATKWRAEGMRLLRQNPLVYLEAAAKGGVRLFAQVGVRLILGDWGVPNTVGGLLANDQAPDLRTYLGERWAQFSANPAYLLLLVGATFIWAIQLIGLGLFAILPNKLRRFVRTELLTVVVLVFVVLLLITVGPEGCARYRAPLVPLIAVLAALGWACLRPPRP